jgi:RNA polymerase-interacting CarD/CdnL/TRCF family regulator
MNKLGRSYKVGDQVIHCVYGLGEIIQLDEKVLAGKTGRYYVVKVRDLTLWVPRGERGKLSLRSLTPAREFRSLFRLLASPGESLSSNRYTRKTQLIDLMKDGTLESICRVIRDLMHYKKTMKFNEHDNSVLKRAMNFLLIEWSTVMSIPLQQAEGKLTQLLETNVV